MQTSSTPHIKVYLTNNQFPIILPHLKHQYHSTILYPPNLHLENIQLSMTEARRIHSGTPCQFRTVTHGQLERFDNKPPPRPLEEPSTVKTAGTIQSVAERGSEVEKDSAGTRGAVKNNTWKPDRGGGWDGKVTDFDARTMYLGQA